MAAPSVGVLSQGSADLRWRVGTQVLRLGLEGARVRPFGFPFCVTSEVEAFGTGVSGFRPPALPFRWEGRMVAVDELAVRECLCPCPGLGDAGVAVCVGAEEVEELREQDDLGEEGGGDECRLSVGSINFWYCISKT